MAAFATSGDLEDFLQLEEPINAATANLALAVASGLIRSYVGWSITSEVVELTTEGNGGDAIWLPTKLLTAVASVEVDGVLLTFGDHYRWKTSGRLRRIGTRWSCQEQSVEINYTHGYSPVPDEVKGIALKLAGRFYNNPEELRAWSVDGLSETMATSTTDAGSVLSDFEKVALDPYVLEGVA